MLAVVAVWAVWQGAHQHGPFATADLADLEPTRAITIDASTGVIDLTGVQVAPGEVVDFLLDGSAGAPHQFILTGAPEGQMDVLKAPDGDTIIRIQVPEDGQLSFFCTIPGHEGLHGTLVVDVDE